MDASSPRHTSTQEPSLSLDTVLELLADQRRRFTLYSLLDSDSTLIEFETVIEDVATLEAAVADHALTRERYQDVAADLYQWHLPVLDDVGVIDYDARHDLIRYFGHPLLHKWATRIRQDELP